MKKSVDIIDKTYSELSNCVDDIYQFVFLYNDYIQKPRDYGNGDPIRLVEVHTLTMIEQNPGITVSELAKLWKRTKGTVSVNVSALERAGYIYREKTAENAKTIPLYPTKKGIELRTMHKAYDNLEVVRTQATILQECTQDQLQAFYKIIKIHVNLLEEIQSCKE